MRSITCFLVAILITGCAASKPSEDEFVTRIGNIAGKEVVELEGGEDKSRTRTSVSASVSSGGGFSIGLGVLMGLGSRASEAPPVRYRVDLQDGEQITVFHSSDLFEVGDCVEIKSLPGDDSQEPQMKRVKDAC